MMNELKGFIELNANEQTIQGFLKSDLSILGDVYACREGEYIAFSEYPLFNGKDDFVVFTGRSKMDIYFIEIKGADFFFLNEDGTVSKKISDAENQIRERFDSVFKNYEFFRRNAHEIRISVEKGERLYNSTIGENGFLHCDPFKEVLYYGVVIGGRTKNDLLESDKKARMQRNSNPMIFYESWDSFLNKIEPRVRKS